MVEIDCTTLIQYVSHVEDLRKFSTHVFFRPISVVGVAGLFGDRLGLNDHLSESATKMNESIESIVFAAASNSMKNYQFTLSHRLKLVDYVHYADKIHLMGIAWVIS